MSEEDFRAAARVTALNALRTADRIMEYTGTLIRNGRASGQALDHAASAVRHLAEAARVLGGDVVSESRPAAPIMSRQRIR